MLELQFGVPDFKCRLILVKLGRRYACAKGNNICRTVESWALEVVNDVPEAVFFFLIQRVELFIGKALAFGIL